MASLGGDSIPLHLVEVKTKRDWSQVKGNINYVDMGNGWVLFKFSTVHDKDFVWVHRPWFVSGLNLVLREWKALFDPYIASITCCLLYTSDAADE